MKSLYRFLGIPEDERAQVALRDRHSFGTETSVLFSYVVIVVLVAMLWGKSSHQGLVVWAVCLGTLAPSTMLRKHLRMSFNRWVALTLLAEAAVGVAWGSVTILALPSDPFWQAVLAVILVGAIVGSALISGEAIAIYLTYLVPVTVTAIIGFLMAGTSRGWTLALCLGVASLFALSVSRENAELHRHLSRVSAESARNAAGLAAEHERLLRANEGLEVANRQLDEQARRDPLTGLANRLLVTERLDQELELLARGRRSSVTVAYMDLDGFKQINDGMGHSAGDRLLKAVAERLSRVTSGGELLARLGGDELIVVAPDAEPDELGERLQGAFDDTFRIDGRLVPAGASIGLASVTEAAASDALLAYADEALYRAKDLGGWRYQVFDAPMRQRFEERRRFESELSDALAAGQIRPWMQPIVDFETGMIVSAEALARWEHSDGTRVAGSFIESVGALGLLDTMTSRFVHDIEELTMQLEAENLEHIRTALNVPPAHLERLLHHFAGSPVLEAVVIELTEESAFGNVERARELLLQARAAGLQVFLDDFGVGFSSLSIATQLPVDGLKIDRSFVATLEASEAAKAVVASVVDLAQRMDLEVIAEGVETHSQLALLRELGVSRGQGFLFSPAVPGDQFIDWLRTHRRFDVNGGQGLQSPQALPAPAR